MRFAKLGLVIAALIPAFAQAASPCDGSIRRMTDLRLQFEKLHYEDDVQRNRGLDLDEAAIQALDSFRDVKASCRPAAFKAFVELSRAQAPFDEESQASALIARYLKDRELNQVYNETIRSSRLANDCRNKLLENEVGLRLCAGKSGGETSADCTEKYSFNYRKCIGMEDLPSHGKRSK